jgi:hypothetical protein
MSEWTQQAHEESTRDYLYSIQRELNQIKYWLGLIAVLLAVIVFR